MFPQIEGITIEENAERLKILYPLRRHWIYFLLLTVMLATWIFMVVATLIFAFRDILFSGERFAFVFSVMILIFLVLLYYLGRLVWRQWQYFTANREILFINRELLIIRRPISILGITDGYDMQFVRPFFYNNDSSSPAFDYGSRTVFFGTDLERERAERLISYLNSRFFPEGDFADDDE